MAIRAIRTTGGVGAQGARGSGTSVAPVAPELTALAVTAAYTAFGNDYVVTLTFAATVPLAATDYPHLKRVEIEQTAGLDLQAPVAAQNAPFSPDGADKIYLMAAPFLLSSLSGSTGFSFRGLVINDDGDASGSPATCSITIAPPEVSAVTATEVADSVYQDENGGLHLVVQAAITATSPQYPAVATFWIDFDDGRGDINQGTLPITGNSVTLRFGDPTASSGGTTQAGNIWVPTDPSEVNWTLSVKMGRWDGNTVPSGAVSDAFTVTAVPAATSSEITNAYLVPDGTTGGELIYGVDHLGGYHWQYNQVNWLQPTTYASPYYWFSALTVQLGYLATGTATVSGGVSIAKSGDLSTPAGGEPDFTADDVGMEIHVGTARRKIVAYTDADHVTIDAAVSNGAGQSIKLWRQAPVDAINGDDGTDENIAEYKGHRVINANPVQGSATVLKTWVLIAGPHPPTWDLPPAKLLDGSDNPYRTFRLRIYSWTRRAANPAGGTSVSELQTCWAFGTADHYDVTPQVQASALDLSQANPTNSWAPTAPISGGDGTPLDIPVSGALTVIDNEIVVAAQGITDAYIADQAVIARTMAASSVTYANAALAANAIVDSNVATVNIGKLVSGTVVFSGNIALARGNGNAVITMDNTGIFLFSACTASGSGVTPGVAGSPSYTAAGVTSSPYVGIQAASIGVFSSLTGPSVTITGSGVNIWSVNGSTSNPRAIFTSSAATITNGLFVLDVTASQIKFSYNSTAVTATLNTTSLAFVNGNYSATIGASSIVLAVSGGPSATFGASSLVFQQGSYSMTLTSSQILLALAGGATATLSSSGLTFANGTSSVAITSSAVTIVNGVLTTPDITITSGGTIIDIDATNYFKLSDAGLGLTYHVAPSLSGPLSSTFRGWELSLGTGTMMAGVVTASGTLVSTSGPVFLSYNGSGAYSLMDSQGIYVKISGGGTSAINIFYNAVQFNGTQVLTTRQTGPGNTTDVTDVATRFNNLLTALRTHGLIT